jgi:hypothetical protein
MNIGIVFDQLRAAVGMHLTVDEVKELYRTFWPTQVIPFDVKIISALEEAAVALNSIGTTAFRLGGENVRNVATKLSMATLLQGAKRQDPVLIILMQHLGAGLHPLWTTRSEDNVISMAQRNLLNMLAAPGNTARENATAMLKKQSERPHPVNGDINSNLTVYVFARTFGQIPRKLLLCTEDSLQTVDAMVRAQFSVQVVTAAHVDSLSNAAMLNLLQDTGAIMKIGIPVSEITKRWKSWHSFGMYAHTTLSRCIAHLPAPQAAKIRETLLPYRAEIEHAMQCEMRRRVGDLADTVVKTVTSAIVTPKSDVRYNSLIWMSRLLPANQRKDSIKGAKDAIFADVPALVPVAAAAAPTATAVAAKRTHSQSDAHVPAKRAKVATAAAH